jgi:hypothetical protein
MTVWTDKYYVILDFLTFFWIFLSTIQAKYYIFILILNRLQRLLTPTLYLQTFLFSTQQFLLDLNQTLEKRPICSDEFCLRNSVITENYRRRELRYFQFF